MKTDASLSQSISTPSQTKPQTKTQSCPQYGVLLPRTRSIAQAETGAKIEEAWAELRTKGRDGGRGRCAMNIGGSRILRRVLVISTHHKIDNDIL
jgi:hypothetical protein